MSGIDVLIWVGVAIGSIWLLAVICVLVMVFCGLWVNRQDAKRAEQKLQELWKELE